MKFILLLLTSIWSSCCLSVKEKYLGNNLYLSEFDNIDRRILYSEDRCSGSGIEIVPMTVIEIAYNDQWIIAKTDSKKYELEFEYWIIKNHYETEPNAETIKDNTEGPYGFKYFQAKLLEYNIDLVLEKID
jgi:hypothetical protein